MARFLFASIPVTAHTSNPLPIAARLVERGHDVLWYAGAAFHERIAATGARPLPYREAHDFSAGDMFDHFPHYRGREGVGVIGDVFAEIFIGHAPQRVADLRAILDAEPVDAMLCDGLMYGVGMVSELGGPPWATFGDGPLGFAEPDTPPFGPGLLPMAGPLGRLRNRAVAAAARKVIFRKAQRVYDGIRADLGLPPGGDALDVTCRPRRRPSSTRAARCRRTSTGSARCGRTRSPGRARSGGPRSPARRSRWCTSPRAACART
jgi:UDP:flavonoid glycosyltransferase YjiC (YdhE family)